MAVTFKEVIDFAIEKERMSKSVYEKAVAAAPFGDAAAAKRSNVKAMFKEMAQEEENHRRLLENLNEKNVAKYKIEKVADLKISEFEADVSFSADMSYRDVLVMGMKSEEKSLALYRSMSEKSNDPQLKKLFQVLIQEEAKHKLKFEKEYDNTMLSED